jgi:hypothetical protein
MIEMAAARHQSHRTQHRFRRSCRHLASRALGWAILSYAFVGVYRALYGAHPTVVVRLGTTLAVLCGAGVVLFGGLALGSVLVEGFTTLWRRWLPRLLREERIR